MRGVLLAARCVHIACLRFSAFVLNTSPLPPLRADTVHAVNAVLTAQPGKLKISDLKRTLRASQQECPASPGKVDTPPCPLPRSKPPPVLLCLVGCLYASQRGL